MTTPDQNAWNFAYREWSHLSFSLKFQCAVAPPSENTHFIEDKDLVETIFKYWRYGTEFDEHQWSLTEIRPTLPLYYYSHAFHAVCSQLEIILHARPCILSLLFNTLLLISQFFVLFWSSFELYCTRQGQWNLTGLFTSLTICVSLPLTLIETHGARKQCNLNQITRLLLRKIDFRGCLKQFACFALIPVSWMLWINGMLLYSSKDESYVERIRRKAKWQIETLQTVSTILFELHFIQYFIILCILS